MVPSGISSRAERFLVILFAGLSFYSHLYGIEVDSVTAKTVAKNFYLIQMAQSSTVTKKGISQDISLDLVHKEYSDLRNSGINQKKGAFTLPLYYVFNVTNQKGFVIVSGDDRVPAILGYAFEGAYLKNDQPPAFQAWMLNYKNQIIYAIENDLKGDLEDIKDWDIYRGIVQTKGIKQIEEVSPLISTAWHQNCYYNYYCPYDTDGDCNRAYAGCVAVAMAQIMKYWEHPYSCNNIPGYDDDINLDPDDNEIPGSDYGWISGISSTAYNWSAMTNTLSSSSSQETMEALCGLLYHCGVSVEMNYGPESSAAFSHKASQAFQSIFKYAQSTNLLNKDDFSDSEWDLILKNELDNYRPVYYDGCIEDGGCHAFICDGYQGSSHFHFEWGWGGSTLNGYYYLDDLVDGSILFPIWQSAIIGIQPDYAVPDPCYNGIEIEHCDWTYAFVGGSSDAAWNTGMCGIFAPGREQIYGFIAPQTGNYSIEVRNASGPVAYGWQEADCSVEGWNCIGVFDTPGVYGTMSWTAGSIYYILLDDTDNLSGNTSFAITCVSAEAPDLDYYSHEIDDDNSTSSGDNDGLVEPGETIEMPVTLLNSGAGDAHNVSAHLSTTDPYINITDGDQSWGTITAGATDTSVDYDFSVSASCPERDVTFILDISSDENTWTDQFTVHVYAPQINPCDNIISIGGCGSGNSQTYSGGGSGSWNNSMCNFSTPGTEQIYSFVAPQTGTYSIEVLSANGYVDYGWSTSCGESGWTCIDDIASMGAYGTMSWTAGTTYYLLLDNEDATTGTHEFFINCPIDPPYLEYHSHVIDDDNSTSSGDNDGLVEPGETIEMPVTLLNSGAGDANNVSAHLSTTDPYITITDADENYGDISAGWTAESSADYDFSVSPSCPEGDVTFTLGITSDEDSWTNQFTITISVQPSTYLEVSPNSRTVAATAGTTSFSVSTNVEWSVTDDASWLTATKTDGTTISVSYSSNTSTSSRTANITVTGTDGISETLTITQSFVSNYINLTPYLPSGWEDKIVVSSERGTFLNGDVTEGQASYIDFAWINDGNVDAGNHKCRLYFDEQEILWAEVPNLTSGYYQNGVDGKYFFIETGWHMLKLIVDADNSVNELNEFDNVYEKQIYIHSITSYRNNLSLSERVLVFPNPTSGMFQLEIQYAISDSYIIKIADPTGKIIMNRKIENQGFVISESVDISWNPSGIYFLQISDNTASVVRKIVIAK